MKTLVKETLSAILATVVLAVLLCGVFPLVVWGGAQLLFPRQAEGSLITTQNREIVGSEWIGQGFTGKTYFHPRPSAAGANGYDAASSSGSNLGPTSQKLIDSLKERVEAYRAENEVPADILVPVDAVTASGSGLDPHISVKNAEMQIPRVAKARALSTEQVADQVRKATQGRSLGLFGEPGVNVLELNLALDQLAAR